MKDIYGIHININGTEFKFINNPPNITLTTRNGPPIKFAYSGVLNKEAKVNASATVHSIVMKRIRVKIMNLSVTCSSLSPTEKYIIEANNTK